MSQKTHAARLLDTLSIPYDLIAYDVDDHDLSAGTVAKKIGLPVEQVFKTLCLRGERHGLCFAVVPGSGRVDLKAVARVRGERKVEPVAVKELLGLTGSVRGGVTALAPKKVLPVLVDEWIEVYDRVSVSAGKRGLQIVLKPADYVSAAGAIVVPIQA
ncbi:MAG: aminoacyl-tRNA deacylase [Myxococcota bacterium]